MAKTIKVIDLLNKIANGEDVPKKIEYSGKEWRLGKNDNKDIDYINDKNIGLFYEYLDSILIECLNDTVEILEEQQDIDIQEIEELEPAMNGNACVIDNKTYTLNQVIKAVKQLDKNIKDKE